MAKNPAPKPGAAIKPGKAGRPRGTTNASRPPTDDIDDGLDPRLLEKFQARAEELMSSPALLMHDSQLNLLIHREIMNHTVRHAKRTGDRIRGAQEYLKASEILLATLADEDDDDAPTPAQIRKPRVEGALPPGTPLPRGR